MTKLTDAYAALRSFVSTALTGYTELTNPYVIEDNSGLFLRQGYGVAYNTGDTTNRRANGSYTADHYLTVTITRLVAVTPNDGAGLRTLIDSIYTTADALIKAVENNPTLTAQVAVCDWQSYGQIDFIIDEEGTDKFIALPLNFRVQYFET